MPLITGSVQHSCQGWSRSVKHTSIAVSPKNPSP
uniref:Uncharacterized protein n=1 Tax=Arundo donax TaxID=35708 RepID=A0A0A9GMC2_ARUDO